MSKEGKASGLETVFVLSAIFVIFSFIFTLQFFSTHARQTRKRNRIVRAKLFKRLGLTQQSTDQSSPSRRTVLGFFHPYCNAGGGGERVLWQAIEHHLRQDPEIVIVIYSGDVGPAESLDATDKELEQGKDGGVSLPDGSKSVTKTEILERCNARFAIPLHSPDLASRIHFLPLSNRILVSDSYWKRLTLLGQAYGSMRMAFEACTQFLPDVFIDSMGYAFAYPVVRLFNHRIPIGAYVHYPMISTDMLQRVKDRKAGHTNNSNVSASKWRSQLKLVYYRLFAWTYSRALRTADTLVANGSWTRNHLNNLMFGTKASGLPDSKKVQVVYPPCDTASLNTFPLQQRQKMTLVSLAQFRPEKEHATQIRIIKDLIDQRKRSGQDIDQIKLICMGSSRNEGDEKRIEGLKQLVKELEVDKHVSFVVNAPYSTILENLSVASIGLSTMIDEHFGINVVEFMAAGLITLSHASAGPLLDIAVPEDGQLTGFHAYSNSEFVEAAQKIFSLGEEEELAMRQRARSRAVKTFSNEAFCLAWETRLWNRLIEGAVSNEEKKRK
ncbi:UDP-Glycosyltransferase/glycogen phosphorylase [Meira miltonrushii]|uniref:GDP-Man:Man(3)GlcNAc(2)-PP-Dol alpha-1,2-mannosyltransferase n=1 Tax=Meira miltonrushii TaxID=1280837 RepID=A0A316VLN8_9BASI|nr:UDP-Glycosyltransferase/glycogen phosphorylase [Meira miltonrushii]PWN38437.1 UDP-Glycosyltransferase/glycogen phosphorylase [Meira miltonrushii]